MPEISHPRSGVPVLGPTIRFVHSTFGVHRDTKAGEMDGHTQGLRSHQYLDDWLVRATSHQACLQHTQELVNNVSAIGLTDELREIRAGAQTRLRFCRLPVCLRV